MHCIATGPAAMHRDRPKRLAALNKNFAEEWKRDQRGDRRYRAMG
jgi:hypothetical protein